MANKTDYMGLSLPLGSESPDINELNKNFSTIDVMCKTEHEERVGNEVDLAQAIATEQTRAQGKEDTIQKDLSDEISRAQLAESTNAKAIENEAARATSAESENSTAISNENARAVLKEDEISQAIQSEITRAKAAETVNSDKIGGEIERATTAEKTLSDNLTNETERAKTAEQKNATDIGSHVADKNNPHGLTKDQLGLGNVDNTSDTNKPVSTAQQKAIDDAYANSNAYTDQKIADLIDGAPKTMDTLKEVADAINEHKTVEEALNAAIGKKANQAELDTHTGNDTIHIVSEERTNWNDANGKKHTHTNKSVLDEITSALITAWNKVTDKLDKTGDASNVTNTIAVASTRDNLSTGEKLSVSLGKIGKWFADLKAVAFTGSYNDLSNKPTSMTANGGDSDTVNGHTVNSDVPANAKFTDTNTWRGIQDNLTSDSATDSLSAKQGKMLKELIDKKPSGGGTITGITMNGASKGTSGVIDLGTVLTGGKQTATSTADGGSNVYTFSDNSTITVKNGSKGSAGTNGINGTSAAWFTGTAVTGTSTSATSFTVSGSKVGDMYLNTSTYNVYRASAANSWVYVCNIKGATGSSGTNGTNGTNGVTPTIKAAAGSNIGSVGTPSVTASTSGTTTTFTFNNLKGAKGEPGTNATTTETGTASAAGLTKLYSGTGTAVDGTMTQKAITEAITAMVAVSEEVTV